MSVPFTGKVRLSDSDTTEPIDVRGISTLIFWYVAAQDTSTTAVATVLGAPTIHGPFHTLSETITNPSSTRGITNTLDVSSLAYVRVEVTTIDSSAGELQLDAYGE